MPEKLVAIVPLVILALALTFDVGYFSAIDINLFTLFSLSEHLVFAAEAIPLVLVVSFFGVVTIGVAGIFVVKQQEDLKVGANKKSAKPARLNLFWAAYMLFAIGLTYYLKQYIFSAFNAAVFILGIIVSLMPRWAIAAVLALGKVGAVAAVTIVLFILVFGVGYGVADGYVQKYETPRNVLRLKNAPDTFAKVIRSGDKGVMFVNAEGRVMFVRMDDIVSISVLPRP